MRPQNERAVRVGPLSGPVQSVTSEHYESRSHTLTLNHSPPGQFQRFVLHSKHTTAFTDPLFGSDNDADKTVQCVWVSAGPVPPRDLGSVLASSVQLLSSNRLLTPISWQDRDVIIHARPIIRQCGKNSHRSSPRRIRTMMIGRLSQWQDRSL